MNSSKLMILLRSPEFKSLLDLATLLGPTCAAIAKFVITDVIQEIKDSNLFHVSIEAQSEENRELEPILGEVGSKLANAFLEGKTYLSLSIQSLMMMTTILASAYRLRHGPLSSDEENPDTNQCDALLPRNNIYIAAGRVGPAVVHISLAGRESNGSNSKKTGSGIIFHKDGFILTCANGLTKKPNEKVLVSWQEQQTSHDSVPIHRTFEASVLTVWKNYNTAVVKINANFELPTAKFGSSSGLHHGDWLIAMCSPEPFQSNVTTCRVSAAKHKCGDLGHTNVKNYLVTSGSTSVGNSSGGPLVNMDGEVVGISMGKVSDGHNLSLVLPMDRIAKAIRRFVIEWKAEQEWLGLKMAELSEENIYQERDEKLDLSNDNEGVGVAEIMNTMIGNKKHGHVKVLVRKGSSVGSLFLSVQWGRRTLMLQEV